MIMTSARERRSWTVVLLLFFFFVFFFVILRLFGGQTRRVIRIRFGAQSGVDGVLLVVIGTRGDPASGLAFAVMESGERMGVSGSVSTRVRAYGLNILGNDEAIGSPWDPALSGCDVRDLGGRWWGPHSLPSPPFPLIQPRQGPWV